MKTVPLSEMFSSLESGSRPKGGIIDGAGDVPSLGAEHLDGQGGFNFSKLKKIPRDFFSSMTKGLINLDDILIVKDGATTGKVSFVDNNFPFHEASINEHVFSLRLDQKKTFPKYVFWHLMSPKGQQQILQDFRGATVGGISRGFMDKVEIPLPPLNEQRRIAAILDKTDAIRHKRQASVRLTVEFRRSVFFEMFGDPATNPKKWEVGVLGDVIHSAKDGPHISPEYSSEGIPFLSARHVKPGCIDWHDLKFVTRENAQIHWKKCKPEMGNILYTKGGTTGLAAVYDHDKEIAIWVHVALLKLNQSRVSPYWLESMLNTKYCYDQSQKYTHGITNQDLGLKRMIKIKMYIPLINEQKKFDDIIRKLKQTILRESKFADQSDEMFNSLMHRAFRGEL